MKNYETYFSYGRLKVVILVATGQSARYLAIIQFTCNTFASKTLYTAINYLTITYCILSQI